MEDMRERIFRRFKSAFSNNQDDVADLGAHYFSRSKIILYQVVNTTVLETKQFHVELFCGQTICAKPAGETLRGIHEGLGGSRGTR